MLDLPHKLQARSEVMRTRKTRCGLGIPCPNCHPPSPRLQIDVLTLDLVKAGHLRTIRMCPFHAVDIALSYHERDTEGIRRITNAEFRSASRELAKALAAATEAISKSLTKVNKLLGIGPGTQWDWDIRQVNHDPWASAVKANDVLLALKRIAEKEAREKPGRIGNTRRQSLVQGMLVAWDWANGRMPDSGNTHFQDHLIAAMKLVEPDYADFDIVKAIRGARRRLNRGGQKKSAPILKDN